MMDATTRDLMSVMDAGAVLTTDEDGNFWLGDDRIRTKIVRACERSGWIYQTRRPVLSGSSLTGRYLISAMGRRFLRIMRAA